MFSTHGLVVGAGSHYLCTRTQKGNGMFAARLIAVALGLALMGLTAPVMAQDRQVLGWGRLASNDATGDGHDRWRTGSYALSLLRGPEWTGKLPSQPGALLEYRLRAEAIAPENLTAANPADRRYVGALSFGLHSHFDWRGTEAAVGLDVIVTGPQSGISKVQERLHAALDLPKPTVTANQIRNDSHLMLSGEVARKMPLSDALTLRPFVAAQLGGETLLRAGMDVTLGRFADGSLMLRDPVTGQRYRGVAGERVPGLTLVAGGDVARVWDSVYLPAGGVALEPVRSRARIGLHWQGTKADVFGGVAWLGPEFKGQREGQVLGSISFHIRW